MMRHPPSTVVRRGERDNPSSSHGVFALPVKRKSPFLVTYHETPLRFRLNSHIAEFYS